MSQDKKTDMIESFQEIAKTDKVGKPFLKDGHAVLKHTDQYDILVGTVKTLGVGINLHRATTLYLLEKLLSAADTAQAMKRIHRIGQEFPCRFRTFTSETVEIEKMVASKLAFFQTLSTVVDTAKMIAGKTESNTNNDDENMYKA
jgi:SNF2 family DNA or RNA helicase